MATKQSDAAALHHLPDLDEDEMKQLAACARVQAFRKNAGIINEGDVSDSIFIIQSGRVKVYLKDRNGKEVLLNTHGPGESFGEMILDEGPRSASVMTLEESRFLVVSKGDFRGFLSEHPDFAMKLINRLMRRVRALTENVGNLALLDVYGRISSLLRRLAVERDGKLVVVEPLTQKNIASRVGASREMVSRILKDLVAGGYVQLADKRIVILKELPQRW